MLRIKLITFDATGTLLQFRAPVWQQYAEAGLKFGVAAHPQALKKNFEAEWPKLLKDHPNYGKNTGLGWQAWWTKIVEGTFNRPEWKENVSKIAEHLIQSFATADAWQVTDGSHQLLEYLKNQSNYKLGVISNYDPRLHDVLKAVNLYHHFDFVLTSYEEGVEKPSKEIFDAALKRCNNVSASEAVHIGDNVTLDYQGARDAGWHGLLVGPKPEIREQAELCQAHRDLSSLKTFFHYSR